MSTTPVEEPRTMPIMSAWLSDSSPDEGEESEIAVALENEAAGDATASDIVREFG
jgi:hypothetical protein